MLVLDRPGAGLAGGVEESWRPTWFLRSLLAVVALCAFFVLAFRVLAAGDADGSGAVRECFDLAVAGDFRSTVPVSCDGGHEYTLLARVIHPAGALGVYPDSVDLTTSVRGACATAVSAAVGVTAASVEADMILLPPSVEAWIDGDRSIGCVVGADLASTAGAALAVAAGSVR